MTDRLAGFRSAGEGGGIESSDNYELLPRVIQSLYTREQWLWMSDGGKATLIERECNPEVFDE